MLEYSIFAAAVFFIAAIAYRVLYQPPYAWERREDWHWTDRVANFIWPVK